ncbi:putative late blight resistance protein homolog R1B-16 [Salvia miltiorrhiza]|uniref:putative late blight resistance protein homolog R1B-16 n=1 Tax=Salvia miltiorrhiza TaxID=226208 RepID=UPI0025ABDA1C|nr:putative late blight resistance protein homolog R1B-16 [Salvia miltiorrhiza]
MSSLANYGLAPFNGKTDFGFWQQKMECILIQQNVYQVIDDSYDEDVDEKKKTQLNRLALSAIVLNLSECVLRKVGRMTSAKELWSKLEELYTGTSLPSKIFLIERFFRFKLDLNKKIDENVDEFTKLVQDIKLTGDKHIDEYAPYALLNAIPDSYSDVKSAIKYGRDNVTLDTVVSALKNKELDLNSNICVQEPDKVMHVRGEKRFNDKSNHRYKPRKCYNCGETGHYIKDCPHPKKKQDVEHANALWLCEFFFVMTVCVACYLCDHVYFVICASSLWHFELTWGLGDDDYGCRGCCYLVAAPLLLLRCCRRTAAAAAAPAAAVPAAVPPLCCRCFAAPEKEAFNNDDEGRYSTVGMGGIGKTTLARYAYHDPLSVHRFDLCVWLTISQRFQLKEILVSALCSLNNVDEEAYEYKHEELLKETLYKCLKGRRYLVVMDDMWDMNVWDDLRLIFPDDRNGSRIIVTTRELSVAYHIDSLHPHHMQLMAVDQSWRLLKERVFGNGDCPLEFEEIGQVIAQNCRGLPLAVVVIAGVLSCEANWEEIARNVSKVVHTNDEKFVEILSLSYEYLPGCLRPCFLYMGCFPEDYEINVSKLIRLWVAEGFLASNEARDMEELGYEYLEELVAKSLVLISKKGSDGKIRTVKIHDLLRGLCLRKCRDENFVCTVDEFSGSFPRGVEHSNRLSVFCNVSGSIEMVSATHTLLLFKHWALDSWKEFRLLKVLDGLTVILESSSSGVCISELIHLRYLGLRCESIRKVLRLVSDSLYQLRDLQTLVVRILSGTELQSFSLNDEVVRFYSLNDEYLNSRCMRFEIWRMPQLRHVVLLDCFLPDPSAESLPCMENLHTLSRVQDFKCSERMMEMMPNLKKLGIAYSYEGTYEMGWSGYELHNLVHLHKLEKLSLYAEPYPNLKDDLSHNIAFPVTLRKLSLSGCRLPWEDMRMIGALPNLRVLKLRRRACFGTQWETTEGEFCQLKVLLIDSTDLLEWVTESSHFPRLERLTLYECNNLREIPCGFGDIPTLELIEVDSRNTTMVESAKCIEEEQQSYGNEQLQVRFLKSRSWSDFNDSSVKEVVLGTTGRTVQRCCTIT